MDRLPHPAGQSWRARGSAGGFSDPLTLSSALACGAPYFAVTPGPVPCEKACGYGLHLPLATIPSHDHTLVKRDTL